MNLLISVVAWLLAILTSPVWAGDIISLHLEYLVRRQPEKLLAGGLTVCFVIGASFVIREVTPFRLAVVWPFHRIYNWLLRRLIPWWEAYQSAVRQARSLGEAADRICNGEGRNER